VIDQSAPEFNAYNFYLFDVKARSLNNLVYWIAQILGSVIMAFILDQKRIRRRVRAFAGWGILFALVWALHIWAYFYQKCVDAGQPQHSQLIILNQRL
jgi:hypothetical protein